MVNAYNQDHHHPPAASGAAGSAGAPAGAAPVFAEPVGVGGVKADELPDFPEAELTDIEAAERDEKRAYTGETLSDQPAGAPTLKKSRSLSPSRSAPMAGH